MAAATDEQRRCHDSRRRSRWLSVSAAPGVQANQPGFLAMLQEGVEVFGDTGCQGSQRRRDPPCDEELRTGRNNRLNSLDHQGSDWAPCVIHQAHIRLTEAVEGLPGMSLGR